MKKIILLCCLLAGSAHAEEWMETPNTAGGKILFLSKLCANNDTGRMVIATMSDGGTVHGCWYYFAEMVHVGGKTSSYDPKTLTYKKNND